MRKSLLEALRSLTGQLVISKAFSGRKLHWQRHHGPLFSADNSTLPYPLERRCSCKCSWRRAGRPCQGTFRSAS